MSSDSFQFYSDVEADFSFRDNTIRALFLQNIGKGLSKETSFANAVSDADYFLESLLKDNAEKEKQ
jgi:hypothetical protein